MVDNGYRHIVDEFYGDILHAYKQFESKKPVILVNLQEKKIYAYPYDEFKKELNARSQLILQDQYEKAIIKNNIVVFIKDNDRKKFVSFNINIENVSVLD